jgi:plastocyanin
MNVEQEQAPTVQEAAPKPSFLARQPSSAPGKIAFWISIVGLLASLGGGIAITIGSGAPSQDIVITGICWLLVIVLLATRFRWAPLVAALVAAYNLYLISVQPYAVESLANPKGDPHGGYGHFIGDVVALALAILAVICCVGAAVQNYRGGTRQSPRWLTAGIILVVGMVIGALFIGALSQPVVATGTTYTNGVPTVHMGAGSFLQSTVTIPKGSSLVLTDDVAALHVIANGSWQNGVAQTASEAGAPTVHNVQVNGGSITIGPFTTAGTYHIFCLVHKGMNLTVIVQ